MTLKGQVPLKAGASRPTTGVDLFGPTVEDDVRRIIMRYGTDAVTNAVKRATKPKRGRPALNDWPELRPAIKADALDWLEGKDPLASRSNASIYRDYAPKDSTVYAESNLRRIQGKLSKKRATLIMIEAIWQSEAKHSYLRHLDALKELIRLDGKDPWWTTRLQNVEGYIADYAAKHGPPSPDLTLEQIKDGSRNALLKGLPDNQLGLLGSLGKIAPDRGGDEIG